MRELTKPQILIRQTILDMQIRHNIKDYDMIVAMGTLIDQLKKVKK